MSASHIAHIIAKYDDSTVTIPGRADVLALPDAAVFCDDGSYDGATFGDDVGGLHPPRELGAERPFMRVAGNTVGEFFVYVYTHNGDMAAYFKLTLTEPDPYMAAEPDVEGISQLIGEAEENDFDVTSVGSCFHYIAENSYGFNTTHPKFDEATWLTPLVDKVKAYHGVDAYVYIEALVGVVGMAGYSLPIDAIEEVQVRLLQSAQIASEYHRKVRTF